ncbi:MAG: HAD family hydrolase, partial [Proteobacteria bacterium]
DVDGTLIDSNNEHAHSWVEAFRQFDLQADYLEIRSLIGKGGDHLLPEVAGLTDDQGLGKKIAERCGEIFREKFLPNLKPFPYVRDLLLAMKKSGLKLVVASSSSKENLSKLLNQAGIEDLIDVTTSADDADASKPEPDIIEAAMKKAKVSPENCVMLGDTPYDIEAASKAHVKTVALLSGGWESRDLNKAAAIYRDAEDLLGHLANSPFSGTLPAK